MAVIEVAKLFEGRGGQDTFEKHRTYTRVYEVHTDDIEDDEAIVAEGNIDGVAVPRLGEEFESDTDAVVVTVDAQQSSESPFIWLVTIEYDSDPPEPTHDKPDNRTDFEGDETGGNTIEKTDRPASPLDEPATWTMSLEDREVPATEGILVSADGNLPQPVVANWAANTEYTSGVIRANGANVYVQTVNQAVSGAIGPTGTGAAIADSPAAWAALTAYVVGNYRVNGGNVYVVTASGTSAGAGGPTGDGVGITDGSVVWDFAGLPAQWTFVAKLTKVLTDPNFAPRVGIVNSAGMPFDPPVMVAVSRVLLSVTKNMSAATASFQYLLALKNAVNVVPWRGIPARCAQIRSLTHDGGKELNDVAYITGRWEISLDPDTHDIRVLDAGAGYIATRPDNTREYQPYEDGKGNQFGVVPLNGAGEPLAPDNPPVYRRFVPKEWRIIDFYSYLPF